MSLTDNSQGGAYAHNLFAGAIKMLPFDSRQTPFLKPHSTAVAGYHDNPRGDNRYYNNLFVQRADMNVYDSAPLPMKMDGNVYLAGAKASGLDRGSIVKADVELGVQVLSKPGGLYLDIRFDQASMAGDSRELVTSAVLGKAAIPDLAYEQPDGTPIRIDTDYLEKSRSESNPTPGPFEHPGQGKLSVKIW